MNDFANLGNNLDQIHSAMEQDPLSLVVVSSSMVRSAKAIQNKVAEVLAPLLGSEEKPPLDAVLKEILNNHFNQAAFSIYKGRQWRIQHLMREIHRGNKQILTQKELVARKRRYEAFLLDELSGSVMKRETHLADFDRGTLRNEQEEINHQRATIAFHQATHDFWETCIQGPLPKSIEKFIDKKEAALTDSPLYHALMDEGTWMHMEGVLQLPIPLLPFTKLNNPDLLSKAELEHLILWVQRLNERQKEVSLRSLGIIFREAVKIIQIEGSFQLTLQDIVYHLEQLGCTLFEREDSSFMSWREKLQPGDEISCNGKKYTLGLPLGPQKPFGDRFKVFVLDNEKVVKIGINRFSLLIEDKKSELEEEHCGIRFVKKIELDREGCAIILEKLAPPLSMYKWTSTSGRLSSEDENIAIIFATHIFYMIDQGFNAEKLSLEHLALDSEWGLKSTRLLKKGVPNYNDWELNCLKLAQGNPYVLHYLMAVSQLKTHSVGLYYREAVKHVLKTGTTDLVTRAVPADVIWIADYDVRIHDLCKQALKLRENSLQAATTKLRQGEYGLKENQLPKIVGERLASFYGSSLTPGILQNDKLYEEVVKTVFDCNWKEAVLESDDSYYQHRFNWIIAENNK